MAGDDFDTLYTKIDAIKFGELKYAAAQWRGFAKACEITAAKAGRAATNVGTHQTPTYQAAADRANPIAQQVSALASRAHTMAGHLATAGEVAARAYFEAKQQKAHVDQVVAAQGRDIDYRQDVYEVQPNGAATASTFAENRLAIQQAKQQAAAKLQAAADQVTKAYNAFHVQSAPGGSSGGTSANGGAGAASSGGPGTTAAPATAESPVAGQEAGDFAGWVRDPRTGYLVDPATGQVYDPQTGRYIDPVTGKPFGEVDRYASRLEGLSGGAPLAGSGPLAGGGGGGPLYGGAVPPSLHPANPAVDQLRQQASQQLVANAAAARQFAANAQGRAPFPPPMHGVAGGGEFGGRGAGRPSKVRASEPRSLWGGHPDSMRKGQKEEQAAPATHWATGDETWSAGTQLHDNLLDD